MAGLRSGLGRHLDVRAVRPEDRGGGSFELGKLIDEHGNELLYDLRDIGVDLRDVFRWGSGVTPSLVLRLLGQLPEGGAYFAAKAESTPDSGDRTTKVRWRGWTYDRFILADIRDGIAAGNWQRGGGKGRKPEPTPRPQFRKPTGRDRMRSAPTRRRPRA